MKTDVCIPDSCRRIAEWKCTSAISQRSGNPHGKEEIQTLIGVDAMRYGVLLTGGTTFGIPQHGQTLSQPKYISLPNIVQWQY